MPMPPAFTRRLHDRPRAPRPGRLPVALVVAGSVIVGAILNATRASGETHWTIAGIAALSVVSVAATQRRSQPGALTRTLIVGAAAVTISFLVFPYAYWLGPAFVSAFAAAVLFAFRHDPLASVSALLVAAAGVAIRLVLSAGDVPQQAVVTTLTVLSLAALGAITHSEWSATRGTRTRVGDT